MSKQTRTSQLFTVSMMAAALGASGCLWEVGTEADFAADAAGDDSTDEKAIVGGANTTIAQHPWQVSLQMYGDSFCGGSIIGERWILTAQHCVEDVTAGDLQIVAGVTQLSRVSSGQTRGVSQIIRFPGYSSPENGKDVALIKLASALTFGANVQPISLHLTADAATPAGATATVSGWGTLRSGGSTPDGLKSVDIPVISNATAQSRYPGETLTSDQLAAGAGGRDSCQGDSGGPLTVVSNRGRVLAGVVSWGYGCGDAEYPGLYARVSSFASWISENTGIALGSSGGTTTPTTPTTSSLLDRSLDGAKGSFSHIAVTVPAGATTLEVVLTGNNGDADLYVRQGARSTESTWDCRPYTDSSNETCTMQAPSAGTWYVSVAGYAAFTGAKLVVTAR
ncbi:MAG: DUF1986 domain-containing protein [Deltaproteobacteria bacterium]|nr:DUF1986 domain-containing protein [Deltaproteobacteria bacterium]